MTLGEFFCLPVMHLLVFHEVQFLGHAQHHAAHVPVDELVLLAPVVVHVLHYVVAYVQLQGNYRIRIKYQCTLLYGILKIYRSRSHLSLAVVHDLRESLGHLDHEVLRGEHGAGQAQRAHNTHNPPSSVRHLGICTDSYVWGFI